MKSSDYKNLALLYESVYDDNTHYDYLQGNCASLALKLHDLTGCRLIFYPILMGNHGQWMKTMMGLNIHIL